MPENEGCNRNGIFMGKICVRRGNHSRAVPQKGRKKTKGFVVTVEATQRKISLYQTRTKREK